LAGIDGRLGRFVDAGLAFSVRPEDFYGEVTRKDVLFSLDSDVMVKPTTWLGIELGATWVQRASNFTEIQYDNVVAKLGLKLAY
jgi:hypothetical protein